MVRYIFLLFTLFVYFVSTVDYGRMENVILLTSSTFNPTTSTGNWLVLFFRKSCGGCQSFSPYFQAAAKYFEKWNPVLRIAALDCEDSVNLEICMHFEISSVPALRYFSSKNPSGFKIDSSTDLNRLRDDLRAVLLKEVRLNHSDYQPIWQDILEDRNTITLHSTTASPSIVGHQFSSVAPAYADDMFKSLSILLSSDISMFSSIKGDELNALKEFLTMLIKALPCAESYRGKLKTLHDRVNETSVITGEQWNQFLKNIEFPIFQGDYVGCKGSAPKYRGYPCGLWTLFHALTVEHYKRSRTMPDIPGDLVAHALHRFMPRFFSCLECSFHFAANTANIARPGENITLDRPKPEQFTWDPSILKQLPPAPRTAYQEVLWLNRIHNRVNKRLSGAISEDPRSPKVQFPPRHICPSCWSMTDDSGTWILGGTPLAERHLFDFLVKHYDSNNWAVERVNTTFIDKFRSFENVPRKESDYNELITVGVISSILTAIAVLVVLILSRFLWRCGRGWKASHKRGHIV